MSLIDLGRGSFAGWRRAIFRKATLALDRVRSGIAVRARRLSRRLTVLLLYAAVAVPGLYASWHAASDRAASRHRDSGPNRLKFPVDRSAGTLLSRDRQEFRHWDVERNGRERSEWDYAGSALGSVSVSRRDRIWLVLSDAALEHPKMLARLDPGALYRLSLAQGSPPLSEELVIQIGRLRGLRELDLEHAASLPRNEDWLSMLPRLERLWLPRPDSEASRARIVRWGVKNGLEPVETGAGGLLLQRPSPRPGVDK